MTVIVDDDDNYDDATVDVDVYYYYFLSHTVHRSPIEYFHLNYLHFKSHKVLSN
jgi:hypothetical protein